MPVKIQGAKIQGAKLGGSILESFGALNFDLNAESILAEALVDDSGTTRVKKWIERKKSQKFFQSTLARMPVYNPSYHNGFPGVEFNSSILTTAVGAGGEAPVDILVNANALTMFLVSFDCGMSHYQTGNDNIRTGFHTSGAGTYRGIIANGSAAIGEKSSSGDTVPTIKCLRYDGAGVGNSGRLKMYKNGVEVTGLSFTGTIPSTTSSTTLAVRMDLGRNNSGAYSNGVIMRFIIYSTVLSPSDIVSVTENLNSKYGIY